MRFIQYPDKPSLQKIKAPSIPRQRRSNIRLTKVRPPLAMLICLVMYLPVIALPALGGPADNPALLSTRYALVGIISRDIAVVRDQELQKTLVLKAGEYLSNQKNWLLERIANGVVYLRSHSHFKPIKLTFGGRSYDTPDQAPTTLQQQERTLDPDDWDYYLDILNEKKLQDSSATALESEIVMEPDGEPIDVIICDTATSKEDCHIP